MQIHLKQREIEAALNLYVAQQGINLTNKVITYIFTAGRKDSGVSVELSIEDSVERNAAAPMPAVTAAPPNVKEEPASETEEMPVKASSLFS